MNELLFFRQFMQGDGMVPTAMLVGLFAIVIFRRESIALPGLFRFGVVMFALSILLPPIIAPLYMYISGTTASALNRMGMGTRMSSSGDSVGMILLLNGTGPTLQALSILCVFNAIMPRVFKKPEPEVPRKHPLDD